MNWNQNNAKQTADSAALLQKINDNWGKFTSIIGRIEDSEVREGAQKLCDDLHDRLAVCPASTRTDYVGCFTGGLVWHSLNVLKSLKEMRAAFELENTVSSDSLIVMGLFHDLGKIGNDKNDYYLPQASDWHRNKGMLFEINDQLLSIPVATRSVWWLNQYGIPLSEAEMHAISSLGKSTGENVSFNPSLKDPWEAYLLQSAVRGACIRGHGITALPTEAK